MVVAAADGGGVGDSLDGGYRVQYLDSIPCVIWSVVDIQFVSMARLERNSRGKTLNIRFRAFCVFRSYTLCVSDCMH